MSRNDGGSAFPFTVETSWQAKAQAQSVGMNLPNTSTVSGMSLRDYFAARSIAIAWDAFDKGYCGDIDASDTSTYQIAKLAYQIADAMLKERAK